ncbi:MAG: response regulator transcription factor [Treponema sp.]|jgi:DNA-binding response OmpR family regulator|nr:response regulator transcription factor [Treponema sp.]
MINILVVEDDEKLNRIVCHYLNEHGYKAIGCLSAVEAFDRMVDNIIGLIVSDIMMPEVDGFKFAAMVREQDKTIPILFITARDDITSKQKGFRIGIDDYMVKPVDLEELILRIGALLRRANIANEKKLTAGSLVLNADEMTATVEGKEIPLTVREFNVLFKLLSYPKKTFTRNQLMDDFWGAETESAPRTVDVYITKLRDKFSDCKDFEIVTVHGLGYKAVLK